MAAAALIAALIGLFLFVQRVSAREDERDLNTQLSSVTRALQGRQQERAVLEETLGTLKAPVPATQGSLPSRFDAQGLGIRFTEYVTEPGRDVRIGSFDSVESSFNAGAQVYPVLSYTIEAKGPKNSLIGLLGLLKEYPSALVQALTFSRDAVDETQWVMKLGLVLFYETKTAGT